MGLDDLNQGAVRHHGQGDPCSPTWPGERSEKSENSVTRYMKSFCGVETPFFRNQFIPDGDWFWPEQGHGNGEQQKPECPGEEKR